MAMTRTYIEPRPDHPLYRLHGLFIRDIFDPVVRQPGYIQRNIAAFVVSMIIVSRID